MLRYLDSKLPDLSEGSQFGCCYHLSEAFVKYYSRSVAIVLCMNHESRCPGLFMLVMICPEN